ncbi:Bug family tripartite tricarboxylate transporter substrate binding protein [Pigmentiphaga kullae]|uniref:Tripartite-type tricarboxylate transporter receptor subunit TctC n=1 Tax=Pigmentiphaga kullae TaxID=151784 RepID=A0A4V2F3I8_9BURK|nr:tripartite tricarboxylate transporter substrate binding protein [Pigmentiphaga kullae]RZS84257.1 tripartite-type tricarboxylate transporter receptor subunit TctC [Pigmentiphaga kullae]
MEKLQSRKAWRRTVAAVFMFTGIATAYAQTYPSQPMHFIVPMAPGGSVDTLARLMAEMLTKKVGQTIVVENKSGAGGVLAASYVARAKPDGYTVFVADTGQLSVNPSLYKDLPYDKSTVFVPVTEAVSAPLFLAVNAKLPVRSVQEFIDYAKKHPGLLFGSTGVGSVHHLGMQLLAVRAGIKMVHVPYKGASQSTVALVGGEVQAALTALPSIRNYVAGGEVRLLAVATPERSVLMPELPTVSESGIKDFRVAVNVGFVLPPGTPVPVANYLHTQITEVLADKGFQQRLITMGLVPMGSTAAEYARNIADDTATYRAVIEASGASQN